MFTWKPRLRVNGGYLVDSDEVSGFELLRLDKASHGKEVCLPEQ